MKRIIAILLLMVSFFALVGCDSENPSTEPGVSDDQTNDNTNNNDSSTTEGSQNDNNTGSNETEGGNTNTEGEGNQGEGNNGENTETTPDIVLEETDVYVVGDSTVCSHNDTTYYYPRYGYGTQLNKYFDEKANIINLSLSGRSSKSFLTDTNYETLSNSISEGDYLVIGFGHNDEKSDDPNRFTDATLPTTDENSFKYSLNEYYIKLAKNVGATPILCTPICRLNENDNYTGKNAHNTPTGDYRQAIIDLGEETNTTVIDLTLKTKELYTNLGYNNAIKYHARTVENDSTVDQTHINLYGAMQVAYMFADELAKTTNALKNYVKDEITAPTDQDLVVNPNYVAPTYAAPSLSTYSPDTVFSTITDGWYGTAFGDTGGNPVGKGFYAREITSGVFNVGQAGSKNEGKIKETEGIAFLFQQVDKTKNFTITADVTISTNGVSQAGFGLMLRDDIYINQTTADKTILSNYVTAGMYMAGSSTSHIIYSRENAALSTGVATTGAYQANDTAELSIERIGQVVNCKVVYKGSTYTKTYTDFDFLAMDNNYMYVGMYATRGTDAEFTNVVFTITGEAQGA